MLNKFLNSTKPQIIAIAIAILLLYLRTLNYEFIGLDEQSLLQDKKSFNKELSNIPTAFKQHVFQIENKYSSNKAIKFYRPLLTVSFILDEQFPNDTFRFNRFVNILIHFLACIGILLVLQQLMIAKPLAFFFALLFAIHPLLVQAVAWIPGRNDSLVCLFIVWSFYFITKKGTKNLIYHLLLFTCAIFTKENAIAFSILCLLYITVVRKNDFNFKSRGILFTGYAVILLLWFLARSNAIDQTFNRGDNSIHTLYYSFLNSAPMLLQYFQKLILPINLSVMSTVSDTNYGWVLITLILFGVALYYTKKIAWAEIIFGLLWFFLFFLPTLLFSYFEGMEHRSYLPIVGLLIAFAHTEPLMKLAKDTKKITILFGSVVLIFGTITWSRVPAFTNELNYWKNAFLSSEHSAIVCRDYGVILTKTGDLETAERVYREGIKRDPNEVLIRYNLAVLYFKTNHLPEAEQLLIEELNLDSTGNPMTYHVLGVIYNQTSRTELAVAMWKKAVNINPNFNPSSDELAKYYYNKENLEYQVK